KVLAPLMGFGGAAVPLVAGLEARYGDPPSFAIAVKLAAIAVMLAGYAFSSWALYENRFFSGVVRIQTDRGHHVIDSGPYRIVRHPGYSGGLLAWLPAPLLLESPWTWIPLAALVVIAVVRIVLEERALCEELPGYREFTSRTRFRLVPGIW
ncbi:MAG: isoprenylcysteine carboxylmethyltransferase family protein, partial [Thermoanaerobaculia bacterium]|nr:isoprenylcysteine carboxylmethyltransferase family protein [Thermoanaerobaculia bacterium]